MKLKKALLIADIQNDFCPGGALGIKDGDKIIPAVNKYISAFARKGLPVFITRDWHPKKTDHFKKYGGPWPEHCVQDTSGAKFHPGLKLPKKPIIMSKGMDPREESYSAFHAVDSNGASLFNLLKILGIVELYVGGLAADYCVKHSVLDALKEGFKATVLTDAIKGVNLDPGDSDEAIEEMAAYGARKIIFSKLDL